MLRVFIFTEEQLCNMCNNLSTKVAEQWMPGDVPSDGRHSD